MSSDSPSIEDLLISKEKPDKKSSQQKLKSKMEDITKKNKEKLAQEKAVSFNMPYVNLIGMPIVPEAISLIPEEQAIALQTVCIYNDRGGIRLATRQPDNPEVVDLINKIKKTTDTTVSAYYISQNSLDYGLDFYKRLPKLIDTESKVEITEEELAKYKDELTDFEALNKRINDSGLTEIITVIIASALETGSSDIHIEAEEEDIKIRLRIDGVLNTVATLPHSSWNKIIARIKLLSKLKLNITTVPQDGRFTIFLSKDKVDVRVSTIPTAFGESVVMRLLKSSSVGLAFEDLGLRGITYKHLEQEILKPNGMIVTTGPTGSGKTTTLYAILNKLNDEETKIITLEDPIEYKLKGINQSQIDHGKEYTFAKGLRSILRQDPDVVMVGEIRDGETSEVAVNAALTGHLVISTIHTNSAAGAIPRFLAMGTQSFLLAPSLNAVIGQRLVRKICKECKQDFTLDEATLKRVTEVLEAIPDNNPEKSKIDFDNFKFSKGKGCEACNNLGYKGRIGIYEVMIMNEEIEQLILDNKATEYKLQDIAVKNGMITMVQDGLLKALEGITSVEEVFKKAD